MMSRRVSPKIPTTSVPTAVLLTRVDHRVEKMMSSICTRMTTAVPSQKFGRIAQDRRQDCGGQGVVDRGDVHYQEDERNPADEPADLGVCKARCPLVRVASQGDARCEGREDQRHEYLADDNQGPGPDS